MLSKAFLFVKPVTNSNKKKQSKLGAGWGGQKPTTLTGLKLHLFQFSGFFAIYDFYLPNSH